MRGGESDPQGVPGTGRGWTLAVAGLYLVTAAAFCAIVAWRYAIFRNGVDLGIFTQVISGIGAGFSATPEGGHNHLLIHWSPIVALGWPFVRAFGPLGLELLSALLCAATLFPLWGLARARFQAPVAFAMVAICALYPILCANAVGDFHEMAFVPLLSASFVWAVDRRRFGWGLAFAALLACTKEDQFLVLLWNGGVLAVLARENREVRRFGALVALIGVGGAGLYFGVVRHLLDPTFPYHAVGFYDWWHPAESGAQPPFVQARVAYVLSILGPLAFVPLFSRYALFLIPGFVEVLASREPVVLIAESHYSAIFTGYALAAFVDGTAVLAARRAIIGVAGAAAAAAASIAISIWASPMEYWYYLYRLPNAHDATLARIIAALPPDADVGAEDEIYAHLALDPRASLDLKGQDYFVYDDTHYSPKWANFVKPLVRAATANGSYVVVQQSDGIVLLRKVK